MPVLLVLAVIAAVLAVPLVLDGAERWRASARRRRRRRGMRAESGYDPGRERRAEQRARQLLRSCVNDEEWAMYRDLGFLRVLGRSPGRRKTDPPSAPARGAYGDPDPQLGATAPPGGHAAPYAYLVYAHKPIVAYVPRDGRLLSEYCVEFPDLHGDGRTRLPPSDDVLAKWMALTSDETRVIGTANMHLVGRQHDPARLRRDLWRLAEWDRRRAATDSAGTAGR